MYSEKKLYWNGEKNISKSTYTEGDRTILAIQNTPA